MFLNIVHIKINNHVAFWCITPLVTKNSKILFDSIESILFDGFDNKLCKKSWNFKMIFSEYSFQKSLLVGSSLIGHTQEFNY